MWLSVLRGIVILLAAFIVGGYAHYLALVFVQESSDLRFYFWGDPWQGLVLRVVYYGDAAIGMFAIALGIWLSYARGFTIVGPLLIGLGLGIVGFWLVALTACLLGC